MKRISMKISAITVALAVTASSITFCVPTKINADLEALTGGCDKTHSGDMWSGGPFLEEGSYHLESDVPLTSEIEITTNVTLCLNGHEIIVENGSRAFNIKDGGSLTLCDCKETGKIIGIHDSDNDSDSENENESNSDNDSDSKDPVKHGGAVYIEQDGSFKMYGGTISGFSANQGGGVYNRGTFTMCGGTISENTSEEGGGVYVNSEKAEFEMTGGTILKNTASHEGGGVYVGGSSQSGVFTMSGGAISSNTVKYNGASDNGGGGVYTAGKFTMSGDSAISDNTAGTIDIDTKDYCMGGGVCVSGENAEFIMESGTLSGNKARYGGGVYVSTNGMFKMIDGKIGNANYADNGGGGVGMGGGEFLMIGGMISENTTDRRGGGVYLNNTGKFTMSSGTISNNESRDGGGVYLDNGAFIMEGGAISNNTTSKYGGGVYLNNGESTMNGGAISDNTSSEGGGVYLRGGEVTMISSEISNNTSNTGGGVYMGSGQFTFANSTISNNSSNNGGGLYLNGGEFKMISGAISGNTAKNLGCGVFMAKKNGGGTLFLDDAVTITSPDKLDGSKSNVYLESGKTITIGNDFSTESIGVHPQDTPTCKVFVPATTFADNVKHKDISGYFTADVKGQSIIYNEDGMVELKGEHVFDTEKWENDPDYHWHECTVCHNATKDTEEHNWNDGEVIKEATCTEAGDKKYTCKDCQLTKMGTIPAGHKYDDKWKNNPDEHWHECTVCGDKKDIDKHNWDDGKVTKEPTCTEAGEETYTCEDCKLTKTETIPAGHKYDDKWKNDPDEHWHECTVCGDKKDTDKHNWDGGKVTKDPTCTEEGNKTYICNDCGRTKTETIPAGHKYDDTKWENDPDNHWHECTVCGDKKDTDKHNWDGGTVTKEPTYTEPGEITYICIDCKREKTETIPPKDPEDSKDSEDSKEPEDSKAPEDSKTPEDSKNPDDSNDPNYPGDSSVTDDSNSSTESSINPDNNEDNGNDSPNPPTGLVISLVPLGTAVTVSIVTVKRKKK